MADLRTRFAALDQATVPDLWPEIERRAAAGAPSRVAGATPTWRGAEPGAAGSRRLVLVLVLLGLLVVVTLLGAALVGRQPPARSAAGARASCRGAAGASTPIASTSPRRSSTSILRHPARSGLDWDREASMDRATWLREQRQKAEADYDTRYAATYDADAEPMTTTHRRYVRRVVRAAPPGGTVLDAACGTGKYFGVVLAAGRHVVGVDQSAGMLDQAAAKHHSAELIQSSLQELDLRADVRRRDVHRCHGEHPA